MSILIIGKGSWKASIAPDQGGNIIDLACQGQQVWRRPEEAPNHYLFGAPVLLPANRTTGGQFAFQGRTYQLPVNEPKAPANLHGLVHLQPFEVLGQGENWAELVYNATPEVYPFPFRLTVRYTLDEAGLESAYQIVNTGDGDMPLTFALHTTFVEPAYFRVPIGQEQERDDHNLATGRYIPLNEQQQTYAQGTDPRQWRISGYFTAAGHEAQVGEYRYCVGPEFDHWILFNGGGGSGQLCVEPQLGAVNGLNQPGGCRVLKPGETLALWTRVSKA